jgi:predicted nucleic acid-binding protein
VTTAQAESAAPTSSAPDIGHRRLLIIIGALLLAAAARNHALTGAETDAAARSWEEFWGATRPVELTPAVQQHAGELARTCALRGTDAVHLASALAVNDPELVVAVWDRRLHTGAGTSGLRVAPATLGG